MFLFFLNSSVPSTTLSPSSSFIVALCGGTDRNLELPSVCFFELRTSVGLTALCSQSPMKMKKGGETSLPGAVLVSQGVAHTGTG